MMMIKKLMSMYLVMIMMLTITCSKKRNDQTEAIVEPPINTAEFAKGADVSWLPQMEATGFVFYDQDKTQKDCLQLLKDRGINTIRLRVFVNPSQDKINGHCSKDETVAMSKRAKALGFRLMIDFHYSDSWADPKKQVKPAAWSTHTVAQLGNDVYNHTYEVLSALKKENITPEWVQVGNEIANGMLHPDGDGNHWDNLALFLNKGYEAVKAVDKSILVVIHIDQGNDNDRFVWFFNNVENKKINYDVIGMSYYPYWLKSDYKATISALSLNLKNVASRYKKMVMVVEIGGDYTAETNTKEMLTAVIQAVKDVPYRQGLGVIYWEPEGAKIWSDYQLNCWRDDGTPSPALDAFK